MRTLTLAAFVAAASLSSFAYAEGGSAAAAYSTAAASQALVQVAAPHRFHANPAGFGTYVGHYRLADGHQLSISQSGSKLFAQVDDQARAELVSVAADSFVGRNANIRVDFSPEAADHQVTVAPLQG